MIVGNVDRYPGSRLLVASQVLLAVAAAAFALLAVIPSIWLLYGLVLAMGTLRTVALPAFELQLMAIVPVERRGTANDEGRQGPAPPIAPTTSTEISNEQPVCGTSTRDGGNTKVVNVCSVTSLALC